MTSSQLPLRIKPRLSFKRTFQLSWFIFSSKNKMVPKQPLGLECCPSPQPPCSHLWGNINTPWWGAGTQKAGQPRLSNDFFFQLTRETLEGNLWSSEVHPFYGQIRCCRTANPEQIFLACSRLQISLSKKQTYFSEFITAAHFLKAFRFHWMPPLFQTFSNLINSRVPKLKRKVSHLQTICPTGYFQTRVSTWALLKF